VPNYVTERGLALLREELASAPPERRAELERRIASAELVAPPPEGEERVRFGATVTVAGRGGRRTYRIVGVDEADAAAGTIAFVSPLARALMGRAPGDAIRVRTPRGEEELELVAVAYR
jgi:transcription elongation factor GreB